jgi:hypothetical protein
MMSAVFMMHLYSYNTACSLWIVEIMHLDVSDSIKLMRSGKSLRCNETTHLNHW